MFNFFKVVRLNKNIKHKSKIISHCSNSTFKVFCNADDEVQIFWRDWECITLHIKNLKLCCIPDGSDYLIVLSQETITSKLFVQMFNISTQYGHKEAILISSSVLNCNHKVSALNAIISNSQIFLSIGLDNGSIYFYKNALQKEITANAFKYYNVTTKPIKGMYFSKNKENIIMFVFSDGGIFSYTIYNNSKISETKLILDDLDSLIHCSTLKPSFVLAGEQYLVIARDDGLYCYTADGRGPCYAISGEKKIVEWFGKQLIIVMKSKAATPFQLPTSQILIYDIDYKIIVMNKDFNEVSCILPVSDHSNCLILLKNGEMFTLKEKELRYKLLHLIKKNFYDVALKMLEEHNASFDIMSNILIQYGDFLLQRGDLPGAVAVYTKTIGAAPPFLIIKRMMDFRYNEILIKYLSKLVQTNFKTPEHLELLNNCFLRINLPSSASRVFDIDDNKLKLTCVDCVNMNSKENLTIIMKHFKENDDFFLKDFKECSNTDISKFLLEYGYYVIKEYPNDLKDLTNYSLSDHLLKKNIFNKILLPLSLMNKLCALHYIENIVRDWEKNSIYNVMTELILQMWFKGHLTSNFVIDFFRSNQPEICIENIFVLCRHYQFWPGIKMLYDKYNLEMLSTHCLAKCYENFPEYVNLFSEDLKSSKLNQMFQVLKKENFTRNYTSKYVKQIVKNIINSNPYYILNTLNSIVNCNNFLISQLDEIIVQEHFLTYFKCDELYSTVSLLENRVIRMEKELHSYLERPIEFRNRSCDVCKQTIKLPSVFFLCQHSFHRECFVQFSEIFVCIVCTDIQKSINPDRNY